MQSGAENVKDVESRKAPPMLPEFTAIRFFAAAYVVLFHIYDNSALFAQVETHFFRKGYLGVDIFFILSGFILTHVYLGAYRRKEFSYSEFMINRVARVYPLHAVMLAVFLALYLVSSRMGLLAAGSGMNWDHLLPHILVVHAWGFTDGHSWNFPSWSISAEFFAYFIFPLFLLFTRIRAGIGIVLSLAIFAAVFVAVEQTGYRLTALMYNFGILRIFCEFLIGVYICMLCTDRRFSTAAAKAALAVVVLAFIGLAHLGVTDLVLVPLVALAIYLLGQVAGAPEGWFMRSRLLVYLGEISYSTYMTHYFIHLVFLAVASRFFGLSEKLPLGPWLLMWALIFLSSVMSFHFVEKPARRMIRALWGGRPWARRKVPEAVI
jgi:peptidoglycan/LPS O-acetylase OafA/YrhL